MKRKKKIKLLETDSPGIQAYEDINMFCCTNFLQKNLIFSPSTCKDLDDMIAKFELIENDVKNINVIKEIMRDWQEDKLSDRHALILILEILGSQTYHYYQKDNKEEEEKKEEK